MTLPAPVWPAGFRIEELSPDSDLTEYETSAAASMRPYDLTTAAELRGLLSQGVLQAWLLRDTSNGKIAGGCLLHLVEHYFPGAPHQYGVWVDAEYRGRGLGRQLLVQSIFEHQDRDITVSVAPDNAASLQLCRSIGFTEYLGHNKYWDNYLRRAAPNR